LVKDLLKVSHQQALLWPKQNHILLLVLGGFGLFVFLNWTSVCFLLPGLAKMLLGIESSFARSSLAMFNTTFLAVIAGLTYLTVDPLVKAVYVLRCFYGESLESGEDLKAELKQLASTGQSLVVCALCLVILSGGVRASWGEALPVSVSAV